MTQKQWDELKEAIRNATKSYQKLLDFLELNLIIPPKDKV